ncbi:MAG: 2TM domain-containing protein [Chitinophagaceae bacterium]|nr:2TM domain-containing protein [Chitinophagaceae bacterium]
MSDYKPAPEGKDPALWEIAQKRASFKTHALTYLIMNCFFWAVWFFSSSRHEMGFERYGWGHFPWPVWPMIGWGIGLAFHFAGAYLFPKTNSVEREYEKLKNQKINNIYHRQYLPVPLLCREVGVRLKKQKQ